MKYIFYIFALSLILAGCTSPRPILYPNTHLKDVGESQAQKDVSEAMKAADKADLNSQWQEKSTQTATSTVVGAGAGVAVGAITGGMLTGGIAGAAGGAASSLIFWAFSSNTPTPLYKQYVNIYLLHKGYEVIGWK